MRHAALLVVLCAILSACGVDGPPVPPEPKSKPGVNLSGTVEVVVTGTL